MTHPLRVRLRQLRTDGRYGRKVSQAELAEALGILHTSISEWESTRRPGAKLPSAERLHDIATVFASRRSRDTIRVLSEQELTDAERADRDRLHAELLALRLTGPQPPDPDTVPDTWATADDPWTFGDGAPVLIVCGAIDQDNRPPYASGENHNYMALSTYADQDALIELFGAIRARNPTSDVRFELSRRLENDDLQAHLVLLGNLAWRGAVALPGTRDQRVRPIHSVEFDDGELLQQVDDAGNVVDTHGPQFLDGNVVEDVGYFYRTRSRLNVTRTLTICGGVFTRGVYGAVRCLTDVRAPYNVDHVAERLSASPTYGLLMRVPVIDHATSTPDLRDPRNVLFEHTD